MYRLTREVRFSINQGADDQLARRPTNSFGGYPSWRGLGHFFVLRATVAGKLDPSSSYLVNIKDVDARVRERGIPLVAERVRAGAFGDGVVRELFGALRGAWGEGAELEKLELGLTPLLSVGVHGSEPEMIRLSQRFEFSASHRLHNPKLSEEENRKTFGKCNNPHGHGHNYELQVTVKGRVGEKGVLVDVPGFERIVAETVIERFDHRNLNVEVEEFRELIPSVENIAKVIYGLLKGRFGGEGVELASVTVWETPKTWCEYSEEG